MVFRKSPPEVISLGDVAVDQLVSVPRYPLNGEDSEVSGMERHPGGSAANFAVAIARLGMRSGFIGKTGSDEAGRFVGDDLKREGVDVSHLKEASGGTGTVIVLVDKEGQRTMLSFRGVNTKLTMHEIPREYIASSKWLHVSGYSLVRAPQCNAALKAMEYGKKAKVRISLDPSLHIHQAKSKVLADALGLADVLFPSEAEAKYLSHKTNLREAGRVLLKKGPSIVAIKLGRRGCIVMTEDEELQIPGFNIEPTDTTGAGDAYDAGFVMRHLRGFDLKRSAEFANAVATLKTMKTGARAGLPRIDEVERFMRNERK